MSLNTNINVRLDPDLKVRVDQIAERANVRASMLIRSALVEYLDKVEAEGRLSIVLDPPSPYKKTTPTKG